MVSSVVEIVDIDTVIRLHIETSTDPSVGKEKGTYSRETQKV